jgi:uncharacterized protein YutD
MNTQHQEVADQLEQYCDYGNPFGLNDLLKKAAELLRNSKPNEENNNKKEEE